MVQLNLLEHYEEVIERQSSEISYVWKRALMLAYFVSSLSSYACAILFYTLWYEVSGGHCLFWGEVRWIPAGTVEQENSTNYDWTREILITHQFSSYCSWFHLACLLSCFAAITFLMMVTICGKGGYDTGLQNIIARMIPAFTSNIDFHYTVNRAKKSWNTFSFVAPWRLVVPALGTSLFMMLVTMVAAHKFSRGYFHLTDSLYQLVYQVTRDRSTAFNYNRRCEVFQHYVATHNRDGFDSCCINSMIQVASWMMTWGWIGGFCILLLRLLTSVDFNLTKISIYELPVGVSDRDAVVQKLQQGKMSIGSQREEQHDVNNLIQGLKES